MTNSTEPTGATREVGYGVAATVTALLSLAGAVWAVTAGGWWLVSLVLTLPLLVVCAYGAADSFVLKVRDEG